MFLFDCFDERLKLISISNCFDSLLDLLLSCRETPQCCFSFRQFWLHSYQKNEKLNTVSFETVNCLWLIALVNK